MAASSFEAFYFYFERVEEGIKMSGVRWATKRRKRRTRTEDDILNSRDRKQGGHREIRRQFWEFIIDKGVDKEQGGEIEKKSKKKKRVEKE